MSSIFGLIAQYKGDLSIFPTVIIIFVLATLLCFILFNKMKWLKYIPGLIGIIMGAVFALDGVKTVVDPGGLETLWKGIYFFVAGCIALGTAWIIALLASMTASRKVTTATTRTKVKKVPKSEASYMRDEDVDVAVAEETTSGLSDMSPEEDIQMTKRLERIADSDLNPASHAGHQGYQPKDASRLDKE